MAAPSIHDITKSTINVRLLSYGGSDKMSTARQVVELPNRRTMHGDAALDYIVVNRVTSLSDLADEAYERFNKQTLSTL